MQTEHRARTRPPGPPGRPAEDPRAVERAAWGALQLATPVEYRRALRTWRAARYALDVALVPLPGRAPAGGPGSPSPPPSARPRRHGTWARRWPHVRA